MAFDPFLKRSPDIAAMVPYWDKVDAIIDGIDAVRAAGEDFLPKFSDETTKEYEFRSRMTKMTNVYRDGIEGLASKPFEQSVQLIADPEPPQEIVDFTYDVDGSGNNLTVFAADTFFNGINGAIDWIMVDYDKPDPNVRTQADAKAAGRRAYWSHVLGRNVIEARSKVIAGSEVLTYIKILEPGKPDHVRVFSRSDAGVVLWFLFERKDAIPAGGDTAFVQVESGVLSIDQIPLVPFYTGRRDGRSWRVFPALQDAADLQIDLYQQESGLKFVKTLTAYPMLAANGMTPPMGEDGKPQSNVAVGPNRVLWGKSDGQGRVGNWSYVEPAAMSLDFLAKDVENTIRNLREIIRQPLTASSSNITVITAAVAAGKARSAVKAWAYKLKDALENALVLTAKFKQIAYDPTVQVFMDFDDWMEGDDMDALLTMNERKIISNETLREEAQRRAVLSSNFTEDREAKRLLDELPAAE